VDTVANGDEPRGLDPETYQTVRPYDAVIPHEADWQVAFERELVAKF
jgi:hypothetical protein